MTVFRLKPLLRLMAVAFALLASGTPMAASEGESRFEFLPGKTVGMEPPPGFVRSKTFSGFLHAKSGSSFVVIELPLAAFEKMTADLSDAELAAKQIEVISREQVTIDGRPAVQLKGTQTVGDKRVEKWILIARVGERTIFLTAQDLDGEALDDAAVSRAFASIRARELPPIDEQMDALPFTLGELAGFRAVRAFGGYGLLLTKGPKDVVQDGSQPVVMIQRPSGSGLPRDVFPADLAVKLLRGVSMVDVTDIGETVSRDVAGGDGLETLATARDKVLHAELVVGQWLRLDSGKQMHVLAILPAAGHEDLLPGLRKMVAELALK